MVNVEILKRRKKSNSFSAAPGPTGGAEFFHHRREDETHCPGGVGGFADKADVNGHITGRVMNRGTFSE